MTTVYGPKTYWEAVEPRHRQRVLDKVGMTQEEAEADPSNFAIWIARREVLGEDGELRTLPSSLSDRMNAEAGIDVSRK